MTTMLMSTFSESDFRIHALPSPPLSDTVISEDANQSISEDSAETIEDDTHGKIEEQSTVTGSKAHFAFDDFPKELRIRMFQLLAVTDLMKAAMVLQFPLVIVWPFVHIYLYFICNRSVMLGRIWLWTDLCGVISMSRHTTRT
jgi:hypothetical protein